MPRVARPLVVLIVDDDDASREVCGALLGQCGFRVLQAENGAVAVEMASVHDPDVIVMDLDMPILGGVEAIQRLKGDARTNPIPVVVLSASTATNHSRAERAGCAAFLVKPCAPADLEGVIRTVALLSTV